MEIIQETTNKKADQPFKNPKELLMYYQSSLRNVFISITFSFAALGYSRSYRGKNRLYSSSIVIVSLLLLFISTLMNIFLYNDLLKYNNLEKANEISQLILINKTVFIVQTLLIFFASYTLFRIIFNKLYQGNV